MWIFCEAGFFSAVQHQASEVTIRARCREDLEALNVWCPRMGAIVETPGRDYAYRATASKADWAAAVAILAQDIDYPNFKEAARRRNRLPGRLAAYHQIWEALRNWQASLKGKGKGRGQRQRRLWTDPDEPWWMAESHR